MGIGGGQSAEHTLPGVRAHAQCGQRGRAPGEVGSSRQRATSRPRPPSTRTRCTRPTGPATCTRSTGRPAPVKWTASIPAATGVFLDKARVTPAVTEDKVIVGTQGCVLVPGVARAARCSPSTSSPARSSGSTKRRRAFRRDHHPVGRRSSTARSTSALRLRRRRWRRSCPATSCRSGAACSPSTSTTGAILWKTNMAPARGTRATPSGAARRRSTPSAARSTSRPGTTTRCRQTVLACVEAAGDDPSPRRAVPAGERLLRQHHGARHENRCRSAGRRGRSPYDAWTVDCIPFFGDGDLCPDPAGPDFDFGQAPALFTTKDSKGKTIESVGAGQKSGQYWALNPDTGAVGWVTQAGPGGTAGGLQWGSAVDKHPRLHGQRQQQLHPVDAARTARRPRPASGRGINAATGAAALAA